MTPNAPIAVFLYNRPEHSRVILECLRQDPVVADSPVTIYCDGPKHADHGKLVAETRAVAREVAPDGARIVERDENFGLARSIITGVTEQCDANDRVIVLEDDLRLSPAALAYFNAALDHYAAEERVMHVAGYIYPVDAELPEAFFYREASCWGWATWSRAWAKFEPDSRKLLSQLRRSGRVREFDIEGSCDYERMLYRQWRGKIDSWAVRWYASVFLNRGLCLHPGRALVANHGLDGSGVHFTSSSPTKSKKFDVKLALNPPTKYPEELVEDHTVASKVVKYHRTWNSGSRKRPFWKKPFKDLHYRLRIPI